MSESSKTPVYFLSHGGPPTMYNTDHPVYSKLQQIGREITENIKPKAVVVFSAHWEGGRDEIYINNSEHNDLIYDFSGFPAHYYKEKFPNVGSKEIAQKVTEALEQASIATRGVKRGLDHGVFVPFKILFDPEKNPLNAPIVQVSLYASEDPERHLALGRAVASLREQNILIICSGMAVHNLYDFRMGNSVPKPYSKTFDEGLREAVETEPGVQRDKALVELLKRKDARPAHPTFEHILPIHVAVGAAGQDRGKRFWTFVEGSVSWAQYKFDEV